MPKVTTNSARRESVKKQTVMRDLRAQITSGQLSPGGRLPTRFELERHYGASRLTVQRALDQLVRDGFVYVQGRQATYVSKTPPHLHRVALAFPSALARRRRVERILDGALAGRARVGSRVKGDGRRAANLVLLWR